MAGSITGVTVSGIEFATQRLARTLSLQKEAMQSAGDLTVKLIQSAALPPEQGRRLDVQA